MWRLPHALWALPNHDGVARFEKHHGTQPWEFACSYERSNYFHEVRQAAMHWETPRVPKSSSSALFLTVGMSGSRLVILLNEHGGGRAAVTNAKLCVTLLPLLICVYSTQCTVQNGRLCHAHPLGPTNTLNGAYRTNFWDGVFIQADDAAWSTGWHNETSSSHRHVMQQEYAKSCGVTNIPCIVLSEGLFFPLLQFPS